MNELISLNLLRLIFDYVKNNKEIDNNFIEKIVNIVVDNAGLGGYVNNLTIYNTPYTGSVKTYIAAYSYPSKLLKVNLESLLELQFMQRKTIFLSDFEKVLYIYTSVVQVLLHELEHAMQFKTLDTDDDSLESLLLRPCLRAGTLANNDDMINDLMNQGFTEEQITIYLLEKQRRYNESYKFSLEERLAEVRSHAQVLEIIEKLDLDTNNLSRYQQLLIYINYLKGYDVVDSPTGYYFTQLGCANDWPKVKINSCHLKLKERVVLGLNISDSEYAVLSDARNLLASQVLR